MKNTATTLEERLDTGVVYTVRATLLCFVGLLTASYLFNFDGALAMILLSAGLFICTAIILAKGALTGKRYKKGAKHRREKWFPAFFKKNESLADEVFKNWN